MSPEGVLAECGRCFGMGCVDDMRNQKGTAPVCGTCRGKGFVYPGKVCCCGGAAVQHLPLLKTWYCGDDRCMNALKARRMN